MPGCSPSHAPAQRGLHPLGSLLKAPSTQDEHPQGFTAESGGPAALFPTPAAAPPVPTRALSVRSQLSLRGRPELLQDRLSAEPPAAKAPAQSCPLSVSTCHSRTTYPLSLEEVLTVAKTPWPHRDPSCAGSSCGCQPRACSSRLPMWSNIRLPQ